MANTASLTMTCGCSLNNSGNNINYTMCATHAAKTHPEKEVVRAAAYHLIAAMQDFRNQTRN